MKHLFLSISLSLVFSLLFAQKSKLSLEIDYGIQGNFFVRSYDEIGGPSPKTYFYNKHFLGSIGGIELKYKLNQRSGIGIAYARSVNSRQINYNGSFNTINLYISDFKISHTDIFDQFYYERALLKKVPAFKCQVGLFYLRMNQQEIDLSNFSNTISFEERNYKNNKLEEGGAFFGIHYSKKIDSKFELGIKSRVYYLISTNEFEAITLTPTLSYSF
jgi:hypothetical protein